MATDLNLFFAFGAGFLSFISPCTLPLYPAFLSYITGMSLDDLQSNSKRMNKTGMLHTLFFLIGFSLNLCCFGIRINLFRCIFQTKYGTLKTNRCHIHRFIRSCDYWYIYTHIFNERTENPV